MNRGIVLFVRTAGGVLVLTGIAKLVSGFGHARILLALDPILEVSFRHLFLTVGTIEVLVGGLCWAPRLLGLQLSIVAWLSTSLAIYRLSVYVVGYERACSCLGTLPEALGLAPSSADNALKAVLTFLLVGCYVSLLCVWRRRRHQPDLPT